MTGIPLIDNTLTYAKTFTEMFDNWSRKQLAQYFASCASTDSLFIVANSDPSIPCGFTTFEARGQDFHVTSFAARTSDARNFLLGFLEKRYRDLSCETLSFYRGENYYKHYCGSDPAKLIKRFYGK
jgi:hypothetical protein